MKPRTRFAALLAAVGLFLPMAGAAQTSLVLQGRVVESGTTTGIQNAIVSIEGIGAVLTTAQGAFRFGSIQAGTYAVRVTALGYASTTRSVTISADRFVTVALEVAPIALDSLSVRNIELEGRVSDEPRDAWVVGAAVTVDQAAVTETDSHGRFSAHALEGVAVAVSIRAFGYLPMDSVVRAREDVTHDLLLARDLVIEAMIAAQVERLETRASPRFVAGFPNLDREKILRRYGTGTHTLMSLLEFEYGPRFDRRLHCVVIDEKVYERGTGSGLMAGIMLNTTVPEEIERLEFMFRGEMLRIYTRAFIQEMTAREIQLRRPQIFPFCM